MPSTERRPAAVAYEQLRARAVRPRAITATQDGRWYWRIDFARRPVWTGWATRAEVQDRASGIWARGEYLPQRHGERASSASATIGGLLDLWLAAKEADPATRPRSLAVYRIRATHLKAVIGSVPLAPTPSLDLLDRYRRARLAQVKARTILHELRALSAAWRWAVDHGKLRPLHGVALRLPSLQTTEPTRHTPTLADALEVYRLMPDGWARVCLALALATGARVSELALLRWADVDTERGSVTFRGTKTHRDRRVPIGGDALELLRGLPRESDRVLGAAAVDTVCRAHDRWGTYADLAGVPRFTTHGVRRLAVRRLIRATDVKTTATITGHSVAVLLSSYVDPSDEDRQQASAVAQLGNLGLSEDNVVHLGKR